MTRERKQCKEVQEMFLDSFSGRLPKERQEFVDTHLQECVVCSREYEAQSRLIDLVDEGRQRPEMSDEFWDGYWDRLQERQGEPWEKTDSVSTSFFFRKAWLPAAAVLLVILGALLGRLWWPGPVVVGPVTESGSGMSIYPVMERHFETLRPLLLDYANYDGQNGGDGPLMADATDKEILKNVLLQNRLLKRMAARSRNQALIGLLEDLDVIIVEMMNEADGADSSASGIGRMIQDNDILLKMKVINRPEPMNRHSSI